MDPTRMRLERLDRVLRLQVWMIAVDVVIVAVSIALALTPGLHYRPVAAVIAGLGVLLVAATVRSRRRLKRLLPPDAGGLCSAERYKVSPRRDGKRLG
jgi:small-conductance mechanosensitive channel